MKCRHCSAKLTRSFLDLGFAPPSNAYLTKHDLKKPERYYPLKVMVCDKCWLVQTEDYAEAADLFDAKYAYFSSTSKSWLQHGQKYTKKIVKKLNLNPKSFVIEIASNDGYLLKNFVSLNIPCIGIEPTKSTATVAKQKGVPVLQKFFDTKLAKQLASKGRRADLIVGNNVYAHVPDINDFTAGLRIALKPGGTITLEFPHLLELIKNNQFDTIYHEHFSYLSLYTVVKIFHSAGLVVWDVEELPTHGGSLRIYGGHSNNKQQIMPSVNTILKQEKEFGLQDLSTYMKFQSKVNVIKNNFLEFLLLQNKLGKKVVGYGAAAKGNTLLNYAGIKSDLISFVCDAANAKQNKFMPGSHIPIVSPGMLVGTKIDYLIIFPWNIYQEVIDQNVALKKSGAKFVTAIPKLKIK